jgi:hypothetical protein
MKKARFPVENGPFDQRKRFGKACRTSRAAAAHSLAAG